MTTAAGGRDKLSRLGGTAFGRHIEMAVVKAAIKQRSQRN
jgi:hypothetical protein